MGKIHREKRNVIMEKESIKRYLIYSIGEIVLVMIGILLAVQINNWNEQRKNNLTEVEIYQNFHTALLKDSTDLEYINEIFSNGLEAQKYFIQKSINEVLAENTMNEIENKILTTLDVSHSFFPRFGIYQEVLNNGEFAYIRNQAIKNQLVEIYERRYKLYEHVDETVEEKIHFNLQPIVKGKYYLFNAEDGLEIQDKLDAILLTKHYDEFNLQLRSMNSILNSTQNIINVMKENIHKSLQLIRKEIKVKK